MLARHFTLVKHHITTGVSSSQHYPGCRVDVGGLRDAADRKKIEPVYDKQTGRLQVLKYDSDGNGKVDTTSHMDGARVLWIEIDKDEDGHVDRWEYYDADQKLEKVGFSRAGDGKEDAWSSARPDGSIARIDISLARDGKVTRREYYAKDTLVRAEEDGDGDGVFDKWETYEGSLSGILCVGHNMRSVYAPQTENVHV